MNNIQIREIDYTEAVNFLLPKHYSGRIPSISWAFGYFIDNNLVAVCTFGKPASNSLCVGVCGKKHKSNVYELNRLCRVDDLDKKTYPLSRFVAKCLNELKKKDIIVISYSDTDMKHHGYIYQAYNFIYTGMTKSRTDKYTVGNKHSRHYKNDAQGQYRKVRSAKHRYIFFCSNKKTLKKEWLNALNYKTEPYPKGVNENYVLGQYLQPKLIKVDKDS